MKKIKSTGTTQAKIAVFNYKLMIHKKKEKCSNIIRRLSWKKATFLPLAKCRFFSANIKEEQQYCYSIENEAEMFSMNC